MATTIQTIETPKKYRALDTSGNNNHGQIYSGRALEFDGVTDCLAFTQTETLEECTAVAWVKAYAVDGGRMNIWSGGNGPSYFSINNDDFVVYIGDGWLTSAKTLEINTWYRVVFIFKKNAEEGGDYKLYINGVEDTANTFPGEGVGTYTNGHFDGMGSLWTTQRFWNGAMTDMQVWNTSWSADDVTYDYLNPESLALNRGGTSLTESNLLRWYPMQDGHRGQQSYILDGANTGLGDEKVTNGDFNGGTTGWTIGQAVWQQGTGNGEVKFTKPDSGNSYIYQTGHTYAAGTVLRYRFDVVDYSGTIYMRIDGYSGGNPLNTSTSFLASDGSVDVYITTDRVGVGVYLYLTGGSAGDTITIDNVSVKAVNDKNHATTVFHGDELVTNGTLETDTTGWTDINGTTFERNTSDVITGDGDLNWAQSETDANYTGFRQTAATAIVTGRTYVLTCTYRVINAEKAIYAKLGASTTISSATLGGFTEPVLNKTSNTTVTYSFTPTESGDFYLMFRTASNIDAEIYIDDISLKEEGLASGWTDADQQLHIPQTALQSYNELAWFDGTADYVDCGDIAAIDSASALTMSCWAFVHDTSEGNPILSKFKDASNRVHIYASGDVLYFNVSASGEIYGYVAFTNTGWNHIVMVFDGSGTGNAGRLKGYVNGVAQTLSFTGTVGTALADTEANVFMIGRQDSAYLGGCVTETSIWADNLSQPEVLELYNDGKALDALTHSSASNLAGYWRNNGLSTWSNLDNPGTSDGTPSSLTETMLLPAGVDATRDTQGFIMNRQKDTSTLNFIDSNATISTIPGDYPYVNAGPNPISIASFSFSAWVKIPHILATIPIFQLGDDNNNHFSIFTTTGSSGAGDIRFSHEYDSTLVRKTTNTGSPGDNCITVDTWHNIVFTATTTTVILYVDGVAQAVVDQTGTGSSLADRNTYIGYAEGSGKHFVGQIDNVLVYDDVLTQAEVLRNYNAGKGSHRN